MGGRIRDNGRKGGKGKALVEKNVGEWWGECVLMVELDGSGRRIVGVKEFVDRGMDEILGKE